MLDKEQIIHHLKVGGSDNKEGERKVKNIADFK